MRLSEPTQPNSQLAKPGSHYGVQCIQVNSSSAAAPTPASAAAASSSDNGLPWWAVLLITLGGLVVLLALTVAVRMRVRRRKLMAAAASPQLDAKVLVPEDSSLEWKQSASPASVDQLPTSSTSPTDSSSSPATTAASAVSPYPEQLSTSALAELWRAKQAGVLEGVKLGPLIGRGSYGRVYKGTWRGTTVAIKVVEHRLLADQQGLQAACQRESALSTLVSHPNVVTTYKAATLAVRPDGKHELYQPPDQLPCSPAQRSSGPAGPTGHQPCTWQPDQLPHKGDGGAHQQFGVEHDIEKGSAGGNMSDADAHSSLLCEEDSAMQTHGHLLTSATAVQAAAPEPLLESWLLLEYCDMGSLEQAGRERMFRHADGSRSLVALYRCLLQVAAGMAHLHSLGIVHGDLKPACVMLRTQNEVPGEGSRIVCKIGDFGLSRLLSAVQSHVSTETFGTLPYMPPEMLRSGRLSASADVYSFGMLMWELWTGEPPFLGEPMMAVFYKIVHGDARPTIPGNCPARYAGMVAACWASDPTARPTFDDIFRQLSQALTVGVESCEAG